MQDPHFIGDLYRPLQPAENEAGKGSLFYKEYKPGRLLQPYVHCFWVLKTPGKLPENYSYRVVSDGCIDLVLDCKDFEGILIAGVSDAAFDIPMHGQPYYFGIRFLPGCVNQFFQFAADEIAGQMLPAEDIIRKELADLAQLLFEDRTITLKIQTAESFLLAKMARLNASLHPRLAAALHYILSTGGNIPIETKAAEWISPRQLRRLFQQHIGCSPKLFARIVRFQTSLKAMQHKNDQHSFYHDGYFDQAHFIKEFRNFYGDTPSTVPSP